MPYRRILVTGAAGFIGNAFLRAALRSDPAVRAMTLDALTYAGHRENLADLPGAERHTFLRGDIADAATVAQAFETFRPDALVNFAAETHVDRSLIDPVPFVRTNVLGTQVLLEAARGAGIRMVQISTDEVYGSLAEPLAATPETPTAPSSPYAASKAAADLLVEAAFRSHEQDVLVTRCTNNYGPRQTAEKLIPLMILRALRDEPLPVYGDGLHMRDWLHVEDHARGVLAALARGRAGATYHFAGGRPVANLEVVRAIVDAAGAAPELIAHVEDRPGHDRRYALDASATRAELDWAPQIAFPRGLADTVRWYREHTDWCLQTASDDLRSFLRRNYADRS